MFDRIKPLPTQHSMISRKRRGWLAASALAGLLVLGACDPRGSASVEELLKQAQEHRAAGNLRATVIELKNALQKEPENGLARMLLGQAFIDLGDSASAEIELRRASELGTEPQRTMLLLAEARLMQGRFDQMLRDFPVGDELAPETRAALLALRARAHLGLGQRVHAQEALKTAVATDSKSVDAWVGLARLALSTGKPDEAGEHLTKAAEIAPEDVGMLAARGDLAFVRKDYEGSEKAYRQILKLRRDDVAALNAQLGIARAQIASGNPKDAATRLGQVLKLAPNDPATNYLRALAAYQLKDYTAAKTHSELALRSAPGHRPSMFIAGAANFALGQYEQTFRHISLFVNEVPNNVEARKLLAATQIRMGQSDKAIDTLRQVAKPGGSEDAHLLAMIGAASAQAGDYKAATGYFARAVAQNPDDATLRTRLGTTQVALGATDEGIEELEKAADLDPKGNADIALIIAHLRVKDYDKALEAAKRLQEKQPTSPNGFTLAGMAEIGRGNEAAAKTAFAKALEIQPGDRNATKNLAALAVREKNFDLARQHLEEALKHLPGDVEILTLMSQVEARAGRPKEGLARLEEAVQANPNSVKARVTLARVYLLSGEPNKALTTLQPALAESGKEAAVLEVVGRAQMALGQGDLAIATFRDLVSARPDSAQARQYLATAYENAGMIDRAVAEIQEALRLSKDAPAMKFQYARLLARANKLDQATKILGELKANHADDPALADLEGAVALANKKPADAVAAYQRLLEKQENNFNFLKLARAKIAAGQQADVESDIQSWLQRFPDDVLVRTSLADLYLTAGKLDKASAEYTEILRVTPDNVPALNNLAWVMSKSGKANEALTHAKRAVQLAPNSPQVLDTLGTTQMAAGQTRDAIQTLRDAAAKAPTDPAIQFHLAQALVSDGQSAEAKGLLRSALNVRAPWPERSEAESLLKQIGG